MRRCIHIIFSARSLSRRVHAMRPGPRARAPLPLPHPLIERAAPQGCSSTRIPGLVAGLPVCETRRGGMGTATIQNIRMLAVALAARGVAPSQLLTAIDLDPQALLDVDGRVPVGPALRAWQVAAELCKDPWFGLSVVDHLRPDYLGGLGLAVHGSATFGDALRRL